MKKTVLLFSIGLFMLVVAVRVHACDSSVTCENVTQANLESCNPNEVTMISAKCSEAFSNIEKAAQPHRAELDKMNQAIAAFQARIQQIEADVAQKTIAIALGEKQLEGLYTVASARIREFYIRSFTNNVIALFFSSTNIGSAFRTIGYQQAAVNEDKKVITQTALVVQDLETKKKELVSEQASLAQLKADTDKRAETIRKLLAQVAAYEGQLQSAMAAISARQQEFLAQKLAGLGIPLFAISGGGCSSDLTNGKDPGFGGAFGFFTFGVPNRVGLNQYGALGRAKVGQNADTILHAYYNFDGYQSVDANITIKVNDSNSVNQGNIIWSGKLNDYVKRIYEVPGDWPSESLKAQVIAIRSYVLATTNNGNMSICANQYCQVFQSGEKGGAWNQAVDDTGTQVMVQGGNPIKAFFSSTHGGYVYSTGDLQGWSATSYTKRAVDTTSGSVSGFSDLRSNAYDRDSPWFYCDWGARSQNGGTAWLKPEEVADIANVILLAHQDGSSQQHLTQPDKPNPDGVDTWDAATVRSKLGDRAYNSVSNVSMSADFGTGRVTSVSVSGDGKSDTFDGGDFKTYFNLRAPANIQIVGPLYNVEKK
ncbi:MAG TPA: SpoIID/LytB domain-containing protein [Patescibacteria group bacterium]|nr:SpoIID/LytB domain-containing protein [Patescibacteria group bacterium]